MCKRKAACRLIYLHITLAVHSSSTSDERTFTILCTVNTVPHTLKLVTVELICRQVLFTCICAELRVDCLGEADKVFSQKTMKLLYSITNKDIANTVMQLGRGCCIYLLLYRNLQDIPVCVFTVYSVVCFLYFSLLVIFIYCRITLQLCNDSNFCLKCIGEFYCICTTLFMLHTATDINLQDVSCFPKGGFCNSVWN